MSLSILTNNPLVYEKFNKTHDIKYKASHNYVEMLKWARDQVHLGAVLLTHPLSGSVKPSETPYKSLAVSVKRGTVDFESLELIEDAIQVAQRMIAETGPCRWSGKVLKDFQVVDYDLVRFAVEHA